jgi:hypothetical protein
MRALSGPYPEQGVTTADMSGERLALSHAELALKPEGDPTELKGVWVDVYAIERA